MLSWLDLARHQIERMAQDAEMNVGLALEGSSIPNNPGRIRMQGTMWMRVQRRG